MKVSVFKGKDRRDRYQGIVTKVGKQKFESARRRLASLVEQLPERISDGDTFEYLARGHEETKKYVYEQRQETHRRETLRRLTKRSHHRARKTAGGTARPAR